MQDKQWREPIISLIVLLSDSLPEENCDMIISPTDFLKSCPHCEVAEQVVI